MATRSKSSAVVTLRQPSFSSPTRWSPLTRTWSKNTALVRIPPQVVIGWIRTPGSSIGTMNTDSPLWRGASGSVRHTSHSWVANSAPVFQSFSPVMTQSSPSRRPVVRRDAKSLPASGSE